MLKLLCACYPEAFAAPAPLALGVMQEIQQGLGETCVPAAQLSRALQFYKVRAGLPGRGRD